MRIAVVSPFIDRRHGTERALAELLERLARDYHCEIHVYSQRVESLVLTGFSAARGAIIWHPVPSVPGPHLLQFLAWMVFNGWCRWRDRHFRRMSFDLLFSPGINCLDADFILVHAVFHRLAELQESSPSSGGKLRNLHRRVYYAVLRRLERRIYSDPQITLAAVSQRTAAQLHAITGRSDIAVIPNGVDTAAFNPEARLAQRNAARARWNLSTNDFALLLIGNDWRNKGLETLLEAASLSSNARLHVIAAGEDDASAWQPLVARLGLSGRVRFSPPVAQVLELYAVADTYVAPSREDSFNLPALEAMACALPVIVSGSAGASEIITDGEDGFILHSPCQAQVLATTVSALAGDPDRCAAIGDAAATKARTLTWDRHASAVWTVWQQRR